MQGKYQYAVMEQKVCDHEESHSVHFVNCIKPLTFVAAKGN